MKEIMTIFLSLFCSPHIPILPLKLLVHSLPPPLTGHNPNYLFCHSPFHSISEVHPCQYKLPCPSAKSEPALHSFLLPPAENTLSTTALALITYNSLGEGSFPQSASQKANSQLHNQSLPSHQAKSLPHYWQWEWKSSRRKPAYYLAKIAKSWSKYNCIVFLMKFQFLYKSGKTKKKLLFYKAGRILSATSSCFISVPGNSSVFLQFLQF